MRTCNACGIEKPLEDYSNDKNRPGGRAYTCKACNRERAKAWARANPERVRQRGNRWRAANRARVNALAKAQRARDPEAFRAKVRARRAKPENKAQMRWSRIFREFGVTRDQWEAIFAAQGGRCGICGSQGPRSRRGWHTDHDHDRTVKHVRGILCHPCNQLLGMACDTISTLVSAIAYLERSRC